MYDTCQDTNFDSNGNILTDGAGDDCIDYSFFPNFCGARDTASFTSGSMCCACGGGQTPRDEDGDGGDGDGGDGDGGDGGDGEDPPTPPEYTVEELVDAAASAAAKAKRLAVGAAEDINTIRTSLVDFQEELEVAGT